MGAPMVVKSNPLASLRGVYVLTGAVVRDGAEVSISLGTLHVHEATSDPAAPPGQWTLALPAGADKRRQVMIDVASRLGLLPVRFAPSFLSALRSPEPMVLVADTNALLHGILAQALRVRERRPTHVAIADQAFMEVHRQREKAHASKAPPADSKAPKRAGTPEKAISPEEQWAGRAERATYLAAAARTLDRVRADGHVTHVARPPDAMVRYLGGHHGAGEADEAAPAAGRVEVGANALRDRLMLEAAAQHRVRMPGIQAWFVTGDALLAEQAKMEGLLVGYGWRCDAIEPPVLASPFLYAHTLDLRHVGVDEFLEELVWSCEFIALQRPHEDRLLVGRLPGQKRERALAAMREEEHGIFWETRKAKPIADDPASGLPRKAPGAERLLSRLLGLLRPSAPADEVEKRADAYLRALGWFDGTGLTDRGRALASGWAAAASPLAWSAWMDDAGADIKRLPQIAALLEALAQSPGATDKQLQKECGESASTVEAQLRLANAFGVAVRLGNKSWPARDISSAELDSLVLNVIVQHVERNASTKAANLAQCFLALLENASNAGGAISVPAFRAAVVRLHERDEIRLSGGTPTSSRAKARVLVSTPEGGVKSEEKDLGHGDFLVPNTPAIVATLPRSAS